MNLSAWHQMNLSVIIPTYNRAGQLLLTLAALEKQTFPGHRFEVIVVDDGSTDETGKLVREYSAPFPLHLLTVNERRGPAHARNLGIARARGGCIVFCDADFLPLPDFLQLHHSFHARHEKCVLSGTPYCYRRAYTCYFPDFSPREKRRMRLVLQRSRLWKNEFLQAGAPVEIITPEEIRRDFRTVRRVLGGDSLSGELKREFLRTDVAPWLLFITRCVSVSKEHLLEAGGFDERLVRGAGEDWELGYRLHRLGLAFFSPGRVTGFHQEHPHSYRTLDDKVLSFGQVLQEKFGADDPELQLLSRWDSSDALWRDIPAYKSILRQLMSRRDGSFDTFSGRGGRPRGEGPADAPDAP